MCAGGQPSSAAAEEARTQAEAARLREDDRQARVRTGREQVNRLFDAGETLTQRVIPGQYRVDPTDPRWVGMSPDAVAFYLRGGTGLPLVGGSAANALQPMTENVWTKTSGAFDADFYDRRRQAGLNYYTPQIADQFQKARDNLAYSLARAGLSRSTAAGQKQAELQGQYALANQDAANKVEADVSNLRGQVEDARTNLMTSLEATSDPEGTANQALGRAQVLQSAPLQYSPLGDLFGGVVGSIGSAVSGVRQAQLNTLLNSTYGTTAGTKPQSRAVNIGGGR